MGGAGVNAGRFESLVDAIHTVIALDHFAGFTIPLGCTPGACGDACFAAHTNVAVNKDDAVLLSFLHGAGGASGHTPWIFTVVARHEDIGRPRQAANLSRADLDDLTEPGACRQTFVGFALHFAGAATNAFTSILKQVVMTHGSPPFVLIDWAFTSIILLIGAELPQSPHGSVKRAIFIPAMFAN